MIIELDVSPRRVDVDIATPSVNVGDITATETVGVVIAQGPPGNPGPQGPPGPVYEGLAWWFGEGPPTTVVGSKPGDRYMDTTTGTIYQLGD